MSRLRLILPTVVAVLAVSVAVCPVSAQLLPILPKPKKPTPTPTTTPQATRTPSPGAARPDLVPAISDVSLQLATTAAAGDVAEGCAESTSGVDLLRFSATSKNVGTADLVLGDPGCPTPCDEHPLEVCRDPDFICSPAAGHNHAHYRNYARYELLDAGGTVVVVGHKQGYCLRDTDCADPVYTCTNQGISAGCSDVYGASLGCQYLDVTDIPAGNYVLRVTIDPGDAIPELSETNNVVERTVRIDRPDAPTPSRTATPVSQATPTAAATPVRTVTPPVVPPTASPSGSATGGHIPASPTPLPTPLPTPMDALDGTAAASCQRAIVKAARMLVQRSTAAVDECAAAVAVCDDSRRRTAGCPERATASCTQAWDRLADGRADFVAAVVARCGPRGAPQLLAPSGLGFAARRDVCRTELGVDLDGAAGLARCIDRQHVCGAGGLALAEDPRLGARLRAGGALASDLCIADLGGGDAAASELADARAIERCGRTLRRAGRRLAARRLMALRSCLAAHTRCLKATGDPAECRRRAATACAARRLRLQVDERRLDDALVRGCGDLDFALLQSRDGLNLAAADSICRALGVAAPQSLADYARCLARQHACAVDDLLRFEDPHAAERIGEWPSPGGACPGAPD